MADLKVKLKRATVPMCSACEAILPYKPAALPFGNVSCQECGKYHSTVTAWGYYEPDVSGVIVGVADAAHALLKCWQDGTFTEMYMSHMNTLRIALTKLENKP